MMVATAQTSAEQTCCKGCDTLLLGETRDGDVVTKRFLVRNNGDKESVVKLSFPLDVAQIESSFGDNAAHIADMKALLARSTDTLFRVTSVVVKGYASPDGVVGKNVKLAADRASALASCIKKAWTDVAITTSSEAYHWRDVVPAVENSSIPMKTEVLKVLTSNLSESDKEEHLKRYDKAWDYLTHTILPTMRYATATVHYGVDSIVEVQHKVAPPKPDTAPAATQPTPTSKSTRQPVAIVEEVETGIIVEVPQKEPAHRARKHR